MSGLKINERSFFINNGKTFKQFVKEVEDSKNNSSNTSLLDYLMIKEKSEIRRVIDQQQSWEKLK